MARHGKVQDKERKATRGETRGVPDHSGAPAARREGAIAMSRSKTGETGEKLPPKRRYRQLAFRWGPGT